jgi:hypothetical protein
LWKWIAGSHSTIRRGKIHFDKEIHWWID